MAVREGDILDGRFELGRVAASGGMGVVFRGINRQTGALVAVKLLRGTDGAERFRREVKVLSGLRHPGIVTYLGHGLAQDKQCLVMAWLEGEDLGTRLAAVEVNLDESVGVGLHSPRPWLRPTRGHHPPRPQAVERLPLRLAARPGEVARLRHRPAGGCREPHRHRRSG